MVVLTRLGICSSHEGLQDTGIAAKVALVY